MRRESVVEDAEVEGGGEGGAEGIGQTGGPELFFEMCVGDLRGLVDMHADDARAGGLGGAAAGGLEAGVGDAVVLHLYIYGNRLPSRGVPRAAHTVRLV